MPRAIISAGPAAFLGAALYLAGATTALAQLSANPRENPPAPARPPPTAQQNPSAPPEIIVPPSPGGNTGVLRPPGNVDPGMKVVPPPSKEFPMPVIPPPGTTGSAQPNAVPK